MWHTCAKLDRRINKRYSLLRTVVVQCVPKSIGPRSANISRGNGYADLALRYWLLATPPLTTTCRTLTPSSCSMEWHCTSFSESCRAAPSWNARPRARRCVSVSGASDLNICRSTAEWSPLNENASCLGMGTENGHTSGTLEPLVSWRQNSSNAAAGPRAPHGIFSMRATLSNVRPTLSSTVLARIRKDE